MKHYDELISDLFSKKPHFLKIDLHLVKKVAGLLGHPEKAFPSVHIAGTNGKGSVALKVAKALEFSGLKVGLFTSPHLFCYRERIQISSQMISEKDVEDYLSFLNPLIEQIIPSPSFFEITTFLAFCYFRDQKVDIAVIEAGIGGLLDTTNILDPLVSVITSIGSDHKEILGDIPLHKAGIIKPRRPVVVGPSANLALICETAKKQDSPLYLVDSSPGFYDLENQNIARKTLQVLPLQIKIEPQALSVRPPCRFEKCGRVIFDVAHNPQGFLKLVEAMNIHFPDKKWVCILGMSKEKEIAESLSILSKKTSHFYLVEAQTTRAASKQKMADILLSQGVSSFTVCPMEKACELALSQEDLIVVTGSFYLMPEARSFLLREVAT